MPREIVNTLRSDSKTKKPAFLFLIYYYRKSE